MPDFVNRDAVKNRQGPSCPYPPVKTDPEPRPSRRLHGKTGPGDPLMIRAFAISAFAALGLLSAASATQATDFTLEGYFSGKTTARGSFSAINGVKRGFDVDLFGRWNGTRLLLREDFRYDDGVRDRKTWTFIKTGPGRYTGTREDVIGETVVRIEGKVARFTYLVLLDPADPSSKVRFFDTMRLNPDGTVENKALVTKYGFPVALTRVDFRRE
ncbi:DUF3833 family protein [Ensifer soli]|uniref:DUF3833 family protein n=1 Tax=Ciceribacter sp. sgz301302 TaxID=3342379 RepID=UPI0035BAA8CC